METFKKRQKEIKRLERQRDKAAKRKETKELKARIAAGVEKSPDDIETPEDGSTSSIEGNLPGHELAG